MDRPATLTFAGELRDLLRRPGPDGRVVYPVRRAASIKDVIESLGPPHTEVYAITVGDRPVGFGHKLAPGDTVAIHPAVFPIDVTRPTCLRPEPLSGLRFLVDANAGRLATLLRLLGFDAAFVPDIRDDILADLAADEGRVVLSRDRNCLKRAKITYGRVIRANAPPSQLRDVLTAFGLTPPYAAFSRCLRCNRLLVTVDKAAIENRLLPKTRKYYEDFSQCPQCKRLYWAGSHHETMQGWIRQLYRPSLVP